MATLFTRANSDYLYSTGNLASPSTGSISFWMACNTLTNYETIITESSGNFEVRIGSAGLLIVNLDRLSSKPTYSITTFQTGVRYHVVTMYTPDPPRNQLNTIYVDGVYDNETSAKQSIATDAAVEIAGWVSTGRYFDGIIEDVRFYNRLLSAEEIETIYACNGTDGIRYGLRNRWMMNEGAPGVAVTSSIDEVGTLDLTVSGTPAYDYEEITARRAA